MINKISERIRTFLFTSEHTLEERLFLLGGIIGSIAMMGTFLMYLGTSENPIIGAGLILGFVILVLVMAVTFRTRKTIIGGSVIVFISNCIVFPFGYIVGGGAYSGSPIWFIIGAIFVFMVFKGKLFWIYLGLTTAAFGVATYIGMTHPEVIVPLSSDDMIYYDTFIAAVVVALVVGAMLKFSAVIYERQNRISEQQAEEIRKLNDAQNRFFSSMSHEIRTPINTIIGLNEMILRDNQISEEVSENAQNIQNASKILLALINDILDLSKIQSGRMEVVEAQYETGKMLSEIVNLLWTRAREKGLEFNVNVGESIPSMLYGDEMRLKQVIINLLTNAIKYTEDGGVTLSVDGEKTDSNIFILRIDVEDTGMGIRKENIPYLFDSFKRMDEDTNRAIEGTGLGLTISKQLMDLMGGTITVDSIYTKGSSFHIELKQKIVDEQPVNFRSITENGAHVREDYVQSFEAPEAHVLIVDDNDMNRMVSRKLLRGTKVKTDLASSGKECLEKTKSTHYDAIFMDHEMPDMDGVETLTRVRAQSNGLCRNTPVIALTANAGSDMNDFYISHGFQAYLAKPIHGSLLEATLLQFLPQELIEKAKERREGDTFHISKSLRKKPIVIGTSSVCDMPESIIREYDIKLMPYYVETEEGRFRDVTEIDSDNLFNYIAKDRTVRASAGTVEEYENFFGEALSEAETVIYISASERVTNGYDNAVAAAGSFGDVIVYDSGNLTSGLGLIAAEAGKLAKSGENAENIIKKLDEFKSRVISTFIMPHIGDAFIKQKAPLITTTMNRVFNFEPTLEMRNGKIKITGYHIGYVTGAAHKFIKKTLSRRDIDHRMLIVTYSGCTVQEKEDIMNEVKKYGEFDMIYEQKSSATIAASTGPNSFGLFYMLRDD